MVIVRVSYGYGYTRGSGRVRVRVSTAATGTGRVAKMVDPHTSTVHNTRTQAASIDISAVPPGLLVSAAGAEMRRISSSTIHAGLTRAYS